MIDKPEHTPLELLETICAEIYGRWDKDMRSGKLLSALEGSLPRYRADVDAVRSALSAVPDLVKALGNARDAIYTGCNSIDAIAEIDAVLAKVKP